MFSNRNEALDLCIKVNKVINSCEINNQDQLKIALKFSVLAAKQLRPYRVEYLLVESFEALCGSLGFSYNQSMLRRYIIG